MKIFYQFKNVFFRNVEENFKDTGIDVYCIALEFEKNISEKLKNRNVIYDNTSIFNFMPTGIISVVALQKYKNIKDKIVSAIGDDKDIVILTENFSNEDFINIISIFCSLKNEMNLNLNIINIIEETFRSDTYHQILRKLKKLENYSSACIINCGESDKDTKGKSEIICKLLPEIVKGIKSSEGIFRIYNHKTRQYEKFDIPEVYFQNNPFYEVAAPGHGKEFCKRLKEYRKEFAENHKLKYTSSECSYKGECKGICSHCDKESLHLWSQVYKPEKQNNEIMINGIERLREDTDGFGIRSLVLTGGCPMNCKYCGNAEYKDIFIGSKSFSVSELGKKLEKDGIYFEQTGGGVTFGGGEPLLQSDFILDFCNTYNMWNVDIETSLNADFQNVQRLVDCINVWHIDIKDMNPSIYRSYTGKDNSIVIENLEYLIKKVSPEKLHIRVPEIPDFNSENDIQKSVEALREMGFTNIEIFKYKN